MARQTEILHRNVPNEDDDAHRPPAGAVPGTLMEVEGSQETRIKVVDYGPGHHEMRELTDPTQIQPYIDKESVTWIDVTGFKNVAAIRTLGEMLDIHPLALADAVNIPQRAKAEGYPDYVFIVTHAPEIDGKGFYSEQVSVLFSDHFVLSFQERSNEDLYQPVRDRIKSARGLIRSKGPAYLGYAIVDVITDTYFPVLDALEDQLDALEKRILGGELDVLQDLYALRHSALDIRRAIESHRDALSTLLHMQVSSIPDEVRLYMRDCLDHALSQVSTAQSMLDYAVSLRELLASEQAQSLNQVIKVLTIVSSIFIPLSFFAGVYGMNFEGRGNMPELSTPYFYWIWWLGMAAVATGMLIFFHKRGWIGRREKRK